MENIILTNNKDLRLVGVKVGVLSTLRFELPLVSASATHVEVIVTSGNVPSAYTATFIADTKRWQCDIAASQFPAVGRQSYEIAYVLDGKQFWDGKGWIDIADATTSGIEPQPRPEPYRYAVVSVNGYGADAQGAVRIPKTFIATNSPTTTEGFMEGDIYFNRETGAMWTLCNVQGTLTWVFNYKNYYTKAETEEAIDRVAAYYITYDAAGNPFPTYAALANATTVYSGGAVRVPTRNDYCVVLADETHQGAEYRYIYAVAEGQTTGSWQAQFPVEGVMTIDQTVTKDSANPVSGGGVWSAIWGALSALPTGFTSLYDWCVSQLAGKASKADVDPLLFAQYYPEGNVKSAAEFTQGIKYDDPNTTNLTITVKPFCNTGTAANDNSDLEGRVVIPPFVDAQGNPYISDDGTRYKVVGVGDFDGWLNPNVNLTAVVVPNTVTNNIGVSAFNYCTALTSVSPLAATGIGDNAFANCESLSSVSLPAATTIGDEAFAYCESLSSVDFGDTPRAAVPSLGIGAFGGVPPSCKIIVPYTQYAAWKAASGWSSMSQKFVRHPEKADKPATFTTGNLAALDSQGNPTDSGVKPSDKLDSTSAAPAFSTSSTYAAGDPVVYNGTLYTFTAAHSGAWTGNDVSAVNALALIQALQSGKLDSDGLTNSNGGYLSAAGLKTNSVVEFSSAALDQPMNSGAALTDSDISDPASPLGAAFSGKASRAANPTAGNLAALDANGNPMDSQIPAANVAVKGNIPYTLGTPIVINEASSEVVGGETVYYGAATLADRTANIVQVTTVLDELRITFPAANPGKVRDFGLRVEIGNDSAVLAELVAPALVPIAPTGETIKIENNAAEIPALADETATAKGVTLLYFSENAPGVFVVKGEQVEEVA